VAGIKRQTERREGSGERMPCEVLKFNNSPMVTVTNIEFLNNKFCKKLVNAFLVVLLVLIVLVATGSSPIYS